MLKEQEFKFEDDTAALVVGGANVSRTPVKGSSQYGEFRANYEASIVRGVQAFVDSLDENKER